MAGDGCCSGDCGRCEKSQDKGRAGRPPRLMRADELFAGSREVWIDHANGMYRLILTKSGRLVLNK